MRRALILVWFLIAGISSHALYEDNSSSAIAADSVDGAELADTIELDADLAINSGDVTIGQNFTAPAATPTFSSMTVTNQINTAGVKIGTNELTTTEFGNLDGLDQALATTSSPTFSSISSDNQPFIEAYHEAAFQITTSDNILTFDTEATDSFSGLSGGTITVTSAGVYDLDVCVGATLGDQVYGTIRVYINGTNTYSKSISSSGAAVLHNCFSRSLNLSANATVAIHTIANTGGPYTGSVGAGNTWLTFIKTVR